MLTSLSKIIVNTTRARNYGNSQPLRPHSHNNLGTYQSTQLPWAQKPTQVRI
jgi:hypothetical protein